MTIDMLAGEPHFIDHLLPVWNALGPLQGRFYIGGRHCKKSTVRYAETVVGNCHTLKYADALGDGIPLIVASKGDLLFARSRKAIIYMEHGAGQSYVGVTAANYVGSSWRPGCVGVLTPGPRSLAMHEAANPLGPPAVGIGCPKLDGWLGAQPTEPGLVVVAFHWDTPGVPEMRSAMPWYISSLEALAERFNLAVHCHPRAREKFVPIFEAMGLRYIETADEVFRKASVLCQDNSSLMYEFAALGRPVIALNAPWYRRDVEHGMRFWSHVPGRQVDDPTELAEAIAEAAPMAQDERDRVLGHVYTAIDGKAAQRAVQAAVAFLDADSEAQKTLRLHECDECRRRVPLVARVRKIVGGGIGDGPICWPCAERLLAVLPEAPDSGWVKGSGWRIGDLRKIERNLAPTP